MAIQWEEKTPWRLAAACSGKLSVLAKASWEPVKLVRGRVEVKGEIPILIICFTYFKDLGENLQVGRRGGVPGP